MPHRFPSVYRRASRLFDELALARADGMFGFVVGSARGFDALVEFYVARSKEGADSRIRQLKRPTAGGPAASLAGDERPTPDPCP